MALGATSRRPPASEAEQYQDDPPAGMRIGIAEPARARGG
jgi:hypothetical protein